MAALAGMLQTKGHKVQGSDANVYPPMSDLLADLGIKIFDGYAARNLACKPDLVIVGNVIRKDNPEAEELAKLKIPFLSFPQALAHFFIQDRISLVAAGTHGKTTTCSLLASTLFHGNEDPSFMIGGIVREFASNFRLGNGKHFVSEGDEYDTAFFDKESKFLHYRPDIAIITSLEFDHADIFNDLEAIKEAFRKFVALLPETGLIIAHLEDENVRDVVSKAKCRVVGYGKDSSNYWQISNVEVCDGVTSFDAYKDCRLFGSFQVQLPGLHNGLNALAVIAAADEAGLSPEQIYPGLASFGGVKRRQEVRGIVDGITVIDDFAHHPTAVQETLNALKLSYGNRRLIAVFEPRTNSSRRSIFQQQYTTAFDSSDITILRTPVPLDNIPDELHFSSSQLADDLIAKGLDAHCFDNADQIIEFLAGMVKSGDVIAILSNGGFENIHARMLERLKK